MLDRPATLTCDGKVTFGQRAFRNPTGAERGADDAARALREFIAAQPPGAYPARGWRTLARTGQVVVFHHGRPDAGVAVTIRLVDDRWRAVGRRCRARRVARGFLVASFQVAERASLTPGSRTIKVTLYGGGCTGDPLRRLRRIEVRETPHAVTILVLNRPVAPLPPGVSCPADQIIGFKKVRLARPLGRRAIRDASRFPPLVIGRALSAPARK